MRKMLRLPATGAVLVFLAMILPSAAFYLSRGDAQNATAAARTDASGSRAQVATLTLQIDELLDQQAELLRQQAETQGQSSCRTQLAAGADLAVLEYLRTVGRGGDLTPVLAAVDRAFTAAGDIDKTCGS